jgi:RimJ/RimL family protein N-acetyltransferase
MNWVDSMVLIETERLILREFREEDWKAVHEYASDLEVVRYMDWGPNTEEETRNFIRRAISQQNEKPRRNFTLAIVLKSENRLIGGCGIIISDPANQQGYIGYCLNRSFWSRGYATEDAKALVRFGFEKLNLHRIFATCDPKSYFIPF